MEKNQQITHPIKDQHGNHVGFMAAGQLETRPFIMTQELIEKFTPDNITSLVNGFNDNMKYNAETDRIAVNNNYKFARSTETKKYGTAIILFGVSIGALFAVSKISLVSVAVCLGLTLLVTISPQIAHAFISKKTRQKSESDLQRLQNSQRK